jgi:tetrapyrrole methylase family protein / MazG family protein
MSITIVGLGPGDGRLITREAWQVLANAQTVYLRTRRHPAAADLPPGVAVASFDELYESARSFDELYQEIVTTLVELAQSREVVYAVPGHPFVGEETVTRLVAAAARHQIRLRIVAGLSFIEPALTALKLDALDGLQIADALDIGDHYYPAITPDRPLLVGQVYSRPVAANLKLALSAIYPENHEVALVYSAGLADEATETIPLYRLDRISRLDHLTSLLVPPLPQSSSLPSLAETVAILRSPEGCPWDQEQTSLSLRQGFLEEFAEVLDALDRQDTDALREELGDLLFHLVMQAQIGAEAGDFTLSQVIAGIDAKLRRRHPHVWGDWVAADSQAVVENWEILKQQEKEGVAETDSTLAGLPAALPALAASQEIQEKVARVGFDWPDVAGVYDKIAEELAELRAARTAAERGQELGDLLFAAVNLARWLAVDAESALRETNLRFRRRFDLLERLAAGRGLTLAHMELDDLEALWQEAKSALAIGDAND